MVKKYQKKLEEFSCKLVRSDGDYDYILLDEKYREDVINYLLSEDFVLFKEEKKSLNFKKFAQKDLIDIDIELDINSTFLKTFFYDVTIKDDLQTKYFKDPLRYKKCINILRYILLLRAYTPKYREYFLENREYLEENNYCLAFLSKSPFKKSFQDFESFLKVMQRDRLSLFTYLKTPYIFRYYKSKLFKKRGKMVAFLGIDGAGKSTVIDVLHKNLGYKVVYLGDSSIRFSKFYKIPFLKPLSIFVQYFEKLARVFKIYLYTLRGKNVLCDRYYFETSSTGFKAKLYTLLYNKLFLKPDSVIVLYNDAEVILSRKQEVTKEEIESFNDEMPKLPFKNKECIKNDSLELTLNKILEIIR